MPSFKAIVIRKSDSGQDAELTDFDEKDLMEGDVTFRVEWSTVNYKDGLAVTGKAPVVRRFPMIAGIDGAGTVETSWHPEWKPGDKVILNGFGCGETHLGHYAGKARGKGDWLVPLPSGLSARAGGIDAVGSTTLANVLSMTRYGGAVAACGLAGGMDLPGSVAPFILRGVTLIGIDSVMCPQKLRREAWKRLENDLDRQKMAQM